LRKELQDIVEEYNNTKLKSIVHKNAAIDGRGIKRKPCDIHTEIESSLRYAKKKRLIYKITPSNAYQKAVRCVNTYTQTIGYIPTLNESGLSSGFVVVVGDLVIRYIPDLVELVVELPLICNIPNIVNQQLYISLVENLLAGAAFGTSMVGGGVGIRKCGIVYSLIMYVPLPLNQAKSDSALVELVHNIRQSAIMWHHKVISVINLNAYVLLQ